MRYLLLLALLIPLSTAAQTDSLRQEEPLFIPDRSPPVPSRCEDAFTRETLLGAYVVSDTTLRWLEGAWDDIRTLGVQQDSLVWESRSGTVVCLTTVTDDTTTFRRYFGPARVGHISKQVDRAYFYTIEPLAPSPVTVRPFCQPEEVAGDSLLWTLTNHTSTMKSVTYGIAASDKPREAVGIPPGGQTTVATPPDSMVRTIEVHAGERRMLRTHTGCPSGNSILNLRTRVHQGRVTLAWETTAPVDDLVIFRRSEGRHIPIAVLPDSDDRQHTQDIFLSPGQHLLSVVLLSRSLDLAYKHEIAVTVEQPETDVLLGSQEDMSVVLGSPARVDVYTRSGHHVTRAHLSQGRHDICKVISTRCLSDMYVMHVDTASINL